MTARLLGAVAAALLLAPATGSAATVTVRAADRHTDEVHYVAAPGEPNRLLVSYAGDARSVTVSDPGAVIVPLGSCTAIDLHTARCVKRPQTSTEFLQSTRAELGDLGDEVRTFRPTPFPIGGVVADGGPGDDLLDGGAGPDRLDGGGGTDTLLGGALSDVLTDGDADGAPNADVLDGGAGHDRVSYARRSGPVRVGLGDARTDGAPGEGDAVRDVEDATGGAGADRLVGDGRMNGLSGGAGDDVLLGRGGQSATGLSELLRGGPGRDRIRGGAGPDAIVPGRDTDRVGCGRAADIVSEPQRGELLGRRCELIRFAFGETREDSLSFSPHPRSVTVGVATFRLGCPSFELLDGELSSCRGPLTLREAAGARRLLGRGLVADSGRRPSFRVRVALGALGRRLAARPAGVRATASIRGRRLPTRAWTIRLRER
jgi:Ca2+-binding RTX toxin-like protein